MKWITPSIAPEQYLQIITGRFLQEGNPIRAQQQWAYMRHKFEFCGLGAPQWLAITKELFPIHGMYLGKRLEEFVLLCFDQEYREVHYTGIEMMQHMLKHQEGSWIQVIEKCIVTESWWDTVDWLAKLTGIHFLRFPEQQHPHAYKWIEGDNMWLQRVAIIHQLMYKERTDEKLLFDLISKVSSSGEFFIQKACGWALRQHAKVYPNHVRSYVESHSLPPLALRETMKQLNKMN